MSSRNRHDFETDPNTEVRFNMQESPSNNGLLRPPSKSLVDNTRDRSASFASTLPGLHVPSNATTEVEKESEAYDDVPLSEALTPDARYANDFIVNNSKFAFSPGQLNKMINPKSLAAFAALGGLEGLVHGLRSDLNTGLSLDETSLRGRVIVEGVSHQLFDDMPNHDAPASRAEDVPYFDRIRVFGKNRLPDQKTIGFFKLFWIAYKDKIIILLTIAAVVSLALGVYEALSGGPKVSWIEGVAICVAILIVTVVTAANDWQKERQFAKLNRQVCEMYLYPFRFFFFGMLIENFRKTIDKLQSSGQEVNT
jgi:Ca2+-transporting ATPase